MTSTSPAGQETKSTPPGIPILLLKTKSAPHDGYEEYFAQPQQGLIYKPVFVPVLEHKLDEQNIEQIGALMRRKGIRRDKEECSDNGTGKREYGGMIFTSQRAVEAFAKIVDDGRRVEKDPKWPYLRDVPIYTVGPATSRALLSITANPPLSVYGSECGNGEALAHYMIEHYGEWYKKEEENPPLLFMVGEQRRDIIPKTLMDPTLGRKAIQVTETVVYGTGVMSSFSLDFTRRLEETQDAESRWAVVFSPTGCEAMLTALELINPETGKVKTGERGGGCGNRKGKRRTYIATIGPTTRDFLRKSFGFEPDVCAETPSPGGIGQAIGRFMRDIKGLQNE